MRISVICPSEIAYRRFMPALKKIAVFDFAGVGYHSKDEIVNISNNDLDEKVSSSRQKALNFINDFGGKLYDSYNDVINDLSVDCIYIPLPPMLHFEYTKKSLMNKKHVLLEKPATLSLDDMQKIIKFASHNRLAIHENYMFIYHSQLSKICEIIESGEIGDIRLYRIAYGFPFRGENDFRYHKMIGGGALLDAGGYAIKLASFFLGSDCRIDSASINYINNFDADIYGQGVLINNRGMAAQISFGMDNDYKCELEIWGSKGTLYTNRILTAPVGYEPLLIVKKNGKEYSIKLSEDDSFLNSIEYFHKCIIDDSIREKHYEELIYQSKLFEDFKIKAKIDF